MSVSVVRCGIASKIVRHSTTKIDIVCLSEDRTGPHLHGHSIIIPCMHCACPTPLFASLGPHQMHFYAGLLLYHALDFIYIVPQCNPASTSPTTPHIIVLYRRWYYDADCIVNLTHNEQYQWYYPWYCSQRTSTHSKWGPCAWSSSTQPPGGVRPNRLDRWVLLMCSWCGCARLGRSIATAFTLVDGSGHHGEIHTKMEFARRTRTKLYWLTCLPWHTNTPDAVALFSYFLLLFVDTPHKLPLDIFLPEVTNFFPRSSGLPLRSYASNSTLASCGDEPKIASAPLILLVLGLYAESDDVTATVSLP